MTGCELTGCGKDDHDKDSDSGDEISPEVHHHLSRDWIGCQRDIILDMEHTSLTLVDDLNVIGQPVKDLPTVMNEKSCQYRAVRRGESIHSRRSRIEESVIGCL
jgi:hypothetical protein